MTITKHPFGETPDGISTDIYTLINDNLMTAKDYQLRRQRMVSLMVPDRAG